MQVVGVTEDGLRLPFQPLQGLNHRRVGTDVVRVRVD